jgi:hypothetical protein
MDMVKYWLRRYSVYFRTISADAGEAEETHKKLLIHKNQQLGQYNNQETPDCLQLEAATTCLSLRSKNRNSYSYKSGRQPSEGNMRLIMGDLGIKQISTKHLKAEPSLPLNTANQTLPPSLRSNNSSLDHEIHCFYGTGMFITVYRKVHHGPYPQPDQSILILTSH